jgi:hypothetical protein
MKMHQSGTLSKMSRILVLLLAFSFTACETPEETAAPSEDDGGGVVAPTVGMECSDHSIGGGNINTSSSTSRAFFVEDIPGTAITSLTMYLKIPGCGAGTTCVTPMDLEVYACADGTTMGNLVGTVSLSAGITQNSQAFTFTFSSPITIPTNCGAGQKAFAFHFTNGWASNVEAQIVNNEASTCYLDRGSSETNATSFGAINGGYVQYWRAIITATP